MDLTSKLPNEILLNVLAESAPYHSLFNHHVSRGPNSIWSRILRHKKSLVLVCKRWNNLASPFLYNHVVLRRGTQLEPFMHALSNSTLGLMVEELTVANEICTEQGLYQRDYDGLDQEALQFRKDVLESQRNIIRKLPHLCQRLKRLNIRAQITAEVVDEILSHPSLLRITDIHFKVDGDFEEHLYFGKFKSFLPKIAGRIRRLSFDGYNNIASAGHRGGLGDLVLEFPALEELRIACPIFSLPDSWSLPRLTRLIIRHDIWVRETLISFLRKNGGGLEQLSLLSAVSPKMIATILSLCPKVEYLAVDSPPAIEESYNSFPSVRRIDLYPPCPSWDPSWDWARQSVALKECVGYFPSLQTVRILWSDLEDLFFLPSSLPLPFEVDPIHVFREGCTWLGVPPTRFQTLSLPNSSETGKVSVQCASLQINEEDSSDEDLTYPPSGASSDEEDTTCDEDMDSDG